MVVWRVGGASGMMMGRPVWPALSGRGLVSALRAVVSIRTVGVVIE